MDKIDESERSKATTRRVSVERTTVISGQPFNAVLAKLAAGRPSRYVGVWAGMSRRGYVECDITDHNGKRIAKAASTCAVLRGEHATMR